MSIDRNGPDPLASTSALGVRPLIAFDSRQFLAARALAGFTNDAQLAEAACVSESLISLARSGLIPSAEKRESIARALRVDPGVIWRECLPCAEVG